MLGWLKTTGAVVFALLACALVVVSLGIGTRMLTDFGKTPAHFLPAQETVAVLTRADNETLRMWGAHFPALFNVQESAELRTVAVLQLADGSQETVLFRDAAEDAEGVRMGPYLLQASPAALQMLGDGGNRLVADARYRSVSGGQKRTASWVYLTPGSLPPPPDGAPLRQAVLEGIVQSASHVAITPEQKGYRVALAGMDTEDMKTVESSLSRLYGDSGWSMALGNPKQVMGAVIRGLGTHELTLFQGSLLQRMEDILGPLISWEFDVMPLLQEPIVLHSDGTGTGGMFLVNGAMHDERRLTSTMDKLHLSFQGAAARGSVTRRTFDDGNFTSEVLEANPDALEDTTEEVGNWQVRRTTNGMSALVTAHDGKRYLISNDPTGFDRWHSRSGTGTSLPVRDALTSGDLVAGGLVNSATARSIRELFPFGLLGEAQGPFAWSAERKGSTMFVILRQQ